MPALLLLLTSRRRTKPFGLSQQLLGAAKLSEPRLELERGAPRGFQAHPGTSPAFHREFPLSDSSPAATNHSLVAVCWARAAEVSFPKSRSLREGARGKAFPLAPLQLARKKKIKNPSAPLPMELGLASSWRGLRRELISWSEALGEAGLNCLQPEPRSLLAWKAGSSRGR